MAGPLEVPLDLFTEIPGDADDATKLYMRAQTVIQTAFYTLGDKDIAPGELTLGYTELEGILLAAVAMLVAGDASLKTKRDVRERTEEMAKYIRTFADALKEAGDTQAVQVLDMLRIRQSSASN